MSQMMTIKLSKPDASMPWGFRLQGGLDFATPLCIQKVNSGSVAEKAGLQVGDSIVSIGGSDALKLRHKEAQEAILKAGPHFDMVVQRGQKVWKPAVTPLAESKITTESIKVSTSTSLTATKMDVQHVGSSHNTTAIPFAEVNGQKIVNAQYNTPLNLYSEDNIAETLSAQAEVLGKGVIGINFKKFEREVKLRTDSPTYKLLHGNEEPEKPRKPRQAPPEDTTAPSSQPVFPARPVGLPGQPGQQGYYNISEKLYCDVHAKQAARHHPPAPNVEPVTVKPFAPAPPAAMTAAQVQAKAPPAPAPAPAPIPEPPAPAPVKEPQPQPAPPVVPAPQPEPIPAPQPEPTVKPEVEAAPAPAPVQSQPEPEHVPAPAPAPVPKQAPAAPVVAPPPVFTPVKAPVPQQTSANVAGFGAPAGDVDVRSHIPKKAKRFVWPPQAVEEAVEGPHTPAWAPAGAVPLVPKPMHVAGPPPEKIPLLPTPPPPKDYDAIVMQNYPQPIRQSTPISAAVPASVPKAPATVPPLVQSASVPAVIPPTVPRAPVPAVIPPTVPRAPVPAAPASGVLPAVAPAFSSSAVGRGHQKRPITPPKPVPITEPMPSVKMAPQVASEVPLARKPSPVSGFKSVTPPAPALPKSSDSPIYGVKPVKPPASKLQADTAAPSSVSSVSSSAPPPPPAPAPLPPVDNLVSSPLTAPSVGMSETPSMANISSSAAPVSAPPTSHPAPAPAPSAAASDSPDISPPVFIPTPTSEITVAPPAPAVIPEPAIPTNPTPTGGAPTFAAAPAPKPVSGFSDMPKPTPPPTVGGDYKPPPRGVPSQPGQRTTPRRGRGVMNQAATSRIPMCATCQRQIRGPFVSALGKTWCPDHFICATDTCRKPLIEMGFVEEQGALYCEDCYEKYLAPICGKCDKRIKGDCLNAVGKQFHPECFCCAYCGKMFGSGAFYLEDGLPYCETDWNDLFTTKCVGCGFPIEAGDRWVEALNNNYHSQCFKCSKCNKNLEGQSFFAKGGKPFCKAHAQRGF